MILVPFLASTVMRLVSPILMIVPCLACRGLGFFIFTKSPMANTRVVLGGTVALLLLSSLSLSRRWSS
jgi:ABC-type proline/glycine betaine transport system permease subunit